MIAFYFFYNFLAYNFIFWRSYVPYKEVKDTKPDGNETKRRMSVMTLSPDNDTKGIISLAPRHAKKHHNQRAVHERRRSVAVF